VNPVSLHVHIDLSRPIELSHTLVPAREEYRMEIETRFTDEWPQFSKYKRQPDAWYIISEMVLNTHCGTHVELPYHHIKDGQDAATFPVENLVGEGCVIDISAWRTNNSKITLDDLKRAAGDRIRPGDIVYFYTGNDSFYYTEHQHNRPWFTTDCIDWLVNEARIKVMGVDTSGHEVRTESGAPFHGQPNHELLLGAGVPLVEYLTHLDRLLNKRFVTFILPVKIAGAEAFPVRVIAFELES
jgi:arylformamidase